MYHTQAYKYLKKISCKLNCILIYFIFFFTSCHQDHSQIKKHPSTIPLSIEDKQWIEEFFHIFFFNHSMTIYTVFGSKPLSSILIERRTREAFHQIANLHKHEVLKEDFDSSFQVYEKNRRFAKNWDKWILFIRQFPSSPFLFRETPSHVKNIHLGFIINVQEMVWTLKNYYREFKAIVGEDFNPIDVTLEFEDPNSKFWNLVLLNPYLMGICYGYGAKNAYLFSLMLQFDKQNPHALFHTIDFNKKPESAFTLKNLPFPKFRSYRLPFTEDPIIKCFIKEKKNIEAHLNNENFFETTLNQMIGDF